jgi:hypothetical protein
LLNISADWARWRASGLVQFVSQPTYSSSVHSNIPFPFHDGMSWALDRGRGQAEAVVDEGHTDLLGAASAPGILDVGCALGDNDWSTLTVEPGDRVLTHTATNAWCDRFPSDWIGRRLVPLFQHAGLREVRVSPKTLVLFRLAVADGLCRFLAIVGRRLAETPRTSTVRTRSARQTESAPTSATPACESSPRQRECSPSL